MANTISEPATIWCLFSVDNNHDQPDNNLVAWWHEKPSLENFFKALGVTMGQRDNETVAVVQIWTGQRQVVSETFKTEYRLEELEEGQL